MAALNNAIVQNGAIPRNAARHPLVKNGNVRPVMLQPLFKEIDELDYGGRILSLGGTTEYLFSRGKRSKPMSESPRPFASVSKPVLVRNHSYESKSGNASETPFHMNGIARRLAKDNS